MNRKTDAVARGYENDFTLKDLEGDEVSLSDFSARYIVVLISGLPGVLHAGRKYLILLKYIIITRIRESSL